MSSSGALPDFSSGLNNTRPVLFNDINNNTAGIIHHQQPMMYNHQRPGFLPDRSQNASFGKRTLADFQNQQFQQHQNPLLLRHLQQQLHQQPQGIGAFPMRSVKPRIFHNPTLDILPEIASNNNTSAYIGRYAMSSQFRHPQSQNTIGFGTGSVVPTPPSTLSYNHNLIQNGVVVVPGKPMEDADEKEKTMIMNRLQELEKQLLDDDIDDQDANGESVSAITGSEWTETIQNLIGTDQKASAPQQQQQPQIQQQINTSSPTSSSSSCSSTVASPVPICPKQLITEAAAAIADGKLESAAEIVTRVSQSANPRGTPEQRLAYYMSLSLKSKLNSVEAQKSSSLIRSKEHYDSVQLLHQHSACFKLGFFAANLAVIEATADAKSLHVVDFDLGDGKKYHTLLQLLSLRKSGKPASVRITAVDVLESGVVDEERSRIALERLSQLSERVGVPLEVKTLRLNKVGDVSRESLSSNDNEVLAVSLAYILSKLPDESVSTENQRDELLRRVKGLKARIVTVVEQDMNCNTAPFQTRVAECCSFYGALLDSMDTNPGMGREDLERIRVEEGVGRVMMNSVACEGGERVERCEVLGKWRARMGMAGFEMKPVSQNVVDSLSSRIMSNNNNINSVSGGGGTLFVKETNGGVCFGWMGRILTVTSAWR